jgi:hypothetical protein
MGHVRENDLGPGRENRQNRRDRQWFIEHARLRLKMRGPVSAAGAWGHRVDTSRRNPARIRALFKDTNRLKGVKAGEG